MTLPSVKKYLTRPNLIFGTGLLFFVLIFSRSIAAMAAHGFTWHFLVLFLFIYLVFDRKKEFHFSTTRSAQVIGGILLTSSFFLLFAGEVSATLIISEFALVPAIWGCVLLLGGYNSFKILFWPLLYLIFISSGIDSLFARFSPFLRHTSAFVSTSLVRPFGFNTMLSGTYLRLPNMVLNVADECSGVNHLIAFSAMILPISAILRLKKVHTIALLLITIPLTILSNSIRISMLIVINYHRQIFTHGPKDILMTGTGFYIGLIFLGLIAFWLSKISPSPKTGTTPATDIPCATPAGHSEMLFILPVIFLIFGFLFISFWNVKPDTFSPNTLPLTQQNGTWKITRTNEINQLRNLPAADSEHRFIVSDDKGHTAALYLGYYQKQNQNHEVAGYLYDETFKSCSVKPLLGSNNNTIKCRICNSSKEGGDQFIVLYANRNRICARPEISKLYTIFDALLYRTTSATIIVFVIPSQYNTTNFLTSTLVDQFLPMLRQVLLQTKGVH